MTKLLKMEGVCEKTGNKPSWVYEMVAKGIFPRPIKLSSRSARWVEDEVDSWIEARRAERDSANA